MARQALVLVLLFASAGAASAREEPYRVLVLHSLRHSLPANTDWYDGLVRGLDSIPGVLVEVEIEAPDLTRFVDPAYVTDVLDMYRRKYRDEKPHLIVPTYTPALQFLLDHGVDLFPGTPIVFCGADTGWIARRELAPHITGITTRRDIAGTLELALHLHPGTRQVAVIVGSGPMDKEFEREARQVLQPFEGRVELRWLQGLPLPELTEAVRALPDRTVILYLIQLQDRAGRSSGPVSTLRLVSPVARAPIYGLWDTLLGNGIVGGRLATLEEDGYQAGRMALRILRGEAPAALPVTDRQVNAAILDGRELARWNIDEGRLPAGSRVLHRRMSVWEEHRAGITGAGLVMALQGLTILALLLSRSRLRRSRIALNEEVDGRRQAETVAVRLRGQLARFGKERTLGAISTTIAHEINQPLIAIQNYAQAARRRAESPGDQKAKLDELLEKIERQAGRAGGITQRVRNLVTNDVLELRPVSLQPLVEQLVGMMGPEIAGYRCRVDCNPSADLPVVNVDGLEVQLVLVNLLQNAMRSVTALEEEADRVVSIQMRPLDEGSVQVNVADRGPGVPSDLVAGLFEPLSSGREDGMGMGLATCQMIIDAHEGRIWYAPNPSGGAMFCFTLPLARG